ncbi:hypothetical protein [Desulfoferrobacter suflitae]|uniref:hypothetical protein n=1 Tax=Desulfoferrobacter suflitae TaxID=2865782 RepID=UPI002164CE64|nr:hypothetical protein [Desulfoferrobacter suflitae]MCK8604049.1 hypothetical protein [Desulfoferrobacter suflitae]
MKIDATCEALGCPDKCYIFVPALWSGYKPHNFLYLWLLDEWSEAARRESLCPVPVDGTFLLNVGSGFVPDFSPVTCNSDPKCCATNLPVQSRGPHPFAPTLNNLWNMLGFVSSKGAGEILSTAAADLILQILLRSFPFGKQIALTEKDTLKAIINQSRRNTHDA